MNFPLVIGNVGKRYGGVQALHDVSFRVSPGITAVIGPNGAGKSTLFNVVTGVDAPDAGTVGLFGQDITGARPADIAALGLIRTFQTARAFPGMTALENVLAGAALHMRAGPLAQMLWLPAARREEDARRAQAESLLELVGLHRFRDAAATALPMGAQKLLDVVRALMARPRVLLLDEPAAGLNDTETAELAALLRAIGDLGIAIVVVEHNMSLVMGIAREIVVLDAGAVLAVGTPAEIAASPEVIAAYIGVSDADQIGVSDA